MEIIRSLFDFVLHIDKNLELLISQYGVWLYLILFVIVFCETGLVVTPFLPGDSLLFAAGALAASTGQLNVFILWVLLCVAAVLGDTVNYAIGKKLGVSIFSDNARVLKTQYLRKTEAFYEKHGNKTIILARFVPIVRTFAPFVAGVGSMQYRRFITYNVIGGVVWVTLFLTVGYLVGNIPIIKNNFSLVTILIIIVSVVPMVLEVLKERRERAAAHSSR
ncbi:MAG: DedA family protein [Chloroflexota bacterium]|jgi:membrane-associated protein|nr:DedA family protein [Chloroflexota bacterium]